MLRPYKGKGSACCSSLRKNIQQIRFEKMDAVGDGVAVGVAAGDGEGGCGNVGRQDYCLWQFFRKGDGDAAGAGADVGDLQGFASESLFAAGSEFAKGEAVEGDFDDVFGFGAGNQD